MNLFAVNILDHYKHPRNKERMENPSVSYSKTNISCGDHVVIDIRISQDQKMEKITFQGNGCTISQAATSMLTEELVGMTLEEVLGLKKQMINELLGIQISPRREKCALLGLLAIQNAILTWQGKAMKQWADILGEK